MKKISLSIAAAILSVVGSTAVMAAELPTYEANGLPISPVQVGLLGAAHVQEQTPSSLSERQTIVLAARKLNPPKAAPITTGSAR